MDAAPACPTKPLRWTRGGGFLARRHGKGSALVARLHHGAEYRVGSGRTGNAYAIPTKDRNLYAPPLPRIAVYVDTFLDYARAHPELEFKVTKIGCGLAGYVETGHSTDVQRRTEELPPAGLVAPAPHGAR